MSDTLLQPLRQLAHPRRGGPLTVVASRVSIAPTWLLLSTITLAAAVVRSFLALGHTTPRLFPDEYIYSALAQSLAHGSLTIRGEPAHFPAILEPLLAAPTWLIGSAELAYHLTQFLHVGAMCLATIPVYLLAKRAGLTRNAGLVCAALSVAIPGMLFSTYVMAEPIAYPLVLGAVAAAVAVLDRPTYTNQFAFLALALLATFARVQFVVLIPIFVVAAVVVDGLHPLRIGRAYRVVIGAIGVAVIAVALAGLGSTLGYYRAVLDLHVDPVAIAHWVGVDLMLLTYGSGIALVPCALLGIGAGLMRAAPRGHRAFAAVTIVLTAALLGQAALYASNGSERFMERYLFYLTPLVPIAFFLGLRRLPYGRWPVVAAAVGFLILTMRVPITGYTVMTGRQDSPLLSGVFRLESGLGFGTGSLVIAVVAALFCLVAITVGTQAFKGAAQLALALTLASFLAVDAASVSQDRRADAVTRSTYALGSAGWVDRANLGHVALLSAPGAARVGAQLDLFWNRSLSRVLLMRGAEPIDVFGHENASIGADGRLVAGGGAVRQPILVEELGSRMALADARLVGRTQTGALWQPSEDVRVAWLATGLNSDGWWSITSKLTVWPRAGSRRTGTLEIPFQLPRGYDPMTFRLTGPGVTRTINVRSDAKTIVRIHVDAASPVSFRLQAVRPTQLEDGRIVVAHGGTPRFISDHSRRLLIPTATPSRAISATTRPA
jgi:hypothetical protein